jgi:hypothetical protein
MNVHSYLAFLLFLSAAYVTAVVNPSSYTNSGTPSQRKSRAYADLMKTSEGNLLSQHFDPDHELFDPMHPGKICMSFVTCVISITLTTVNILGRYLFIYRRYRGYATGNFVRTISRIGVFIIGGILATMEVLSYRGYISINYDKIVHDSQVPYPYDH